MYKFEKDREIFGKPREKVISTLQKDSMNADFSMSQRSGGRSGDLVIEEIQYDLLIGGREGGWNDGRIVAIYQATVNSVNGRGQYLSVIMQSNSDGRGFDDQVQRVFDEMNFAPKFSYLPQEGAVFGYRTFKSWIDTIVIPDLRLFCRE